MKKLIFFLFILNANPVFCQIEKPYFQQQTNFKIEVVLDDVNNKLQAFEVIDYTNNSPDTLYYIWFHLWPNAYKNDRTAFSEQLLQLNRSDFYFSSEEKRGYINRLDFKVNNVTASLTDHSLYIDVVRLNLPAPLPPGKTIKITTPFQVKIPYNFSRGGYIDNTYQITQWYPKPAVYDRNGWHTMPYLDQGEYFSDFGDYNVEITVPNKYKVAATGQLKDNASDSTNSTGMGLETAKNTSTYFYSQKNVHDFAWFADKNFIIKQDTLQLKSGKVINVAAYFTPEGKDIWKNSISYIKKSILSRSTFLGEYPYNTATAVEAKMGFAGGMEYPTITSISPPGSERELEMTIEHEIGHNWNQGILATNERDFPWMDEGINTYYDDRYAQLNPGHEHNEDTKGFFKKRLPRDFSDFTYRLAIANKTDQPINTTSQNFSENNYGIIAYYKSSLWMKKLENYMGRLSFDSTMKVYYEQWKFKHPYPKDFEQVFQKESDKNVEPIFDLLDKKGFLEEQPKKTIKPAFLFSLKETGKYNYVFLSPAVGANYYDKIMLGALIHNYTLPEPDFHFLLAPMYATGSKRFTGLARAGYNLMSYGSIRKAEISLSGESFSMNEYTDSTGMENFIGFSKLVPSLKLTFRNKNAQSQVNKYIQWKTYFIEESSLLFNTDTIQQTTVITYPKSNRYLNQLTFNLDNNRVLYPYSANIIAEQAEDFVRFAFTGKYFFNYPNGGGMNARLFAGKFIYLGDKTLTKQFNTRRYQLNMSAPNGEDDYTYSNYFAGRNEYEKAPSQQIMIRDGGFKVHTDFLYNKIGKTDNWLAALNLKTDIPPTLNPLQVLPFKIPLKLFFDAGTYAEAWQKDAPTGKFIYDAGFQISLFKDLVNVYVPLLYSKVYSNYFKSSIEGNRFLKNISFSIDIQNFKLSKILDVPGL
ncbi:MAG: M1 family metallopeptidase [Ginsengibacter sp.]